MAKHRKKQQWKKRREREGTINIPAAAKRTRMAGMTEAERYEIALEQGQKLADYILGKGEDVLPKRSIGGGKTKQQLRVIYDYYSREDIQLEMFKYGAGRKITFLRTFKPQYERIRRAEDVLPIALSTLFQSGGDYYPSLHGTISKLSHANNWICDIVIEIDYKSSWTACFEMTRPIVEWLQEIGAVFRIKYSGNCSPHIIIPAEAFPEKVDGKYMFPGQHNGFFRNLTEIVKSITKEPRYLDTSFHIQTHFLRLAYSLNENTGLVSLPFHASQYDSFNPSDARPPHIKTINGWWSVPKDAPKRMEEFINAVLKRRVIVSTARAGVIQRQGIPEKGMPRKAQWDIIRQKRQIQRPTHVPSFLMTKEQLYERMVKIGQDRIDWREFLLLEDENAKAALRLLRRFKNDGRNVDVPGIAKFCDIDEEDLQFLWDWDVNERIFRYYGQDEIRQAIYELATSRKVRVGNEERPITIKEPMDVLPLAVYAHFDAKVKCNIPSFACTTSKYTPAGERPIASDILIYFTTKHESESPFEAAEPVVAMLAGNEMTFLMFYDGKRGPNIIIPYEALPPSKDWVLPHHERTVAELSTCLKRFMRMPGATCRLSKNPHEFIPVPYSLHPETGFVYMPIDPSEIQNFTEKDAWMGNTEVNNDWWNIPPDAQRRTERFLRDVMIEPVF